MFIHGRLQRGGRTSPSRGVFRGDRRLNIHPRASTVVGGGYIFIQGRPHWGKEARYLSRGVSSGLGEGRHDINPGVLSGEGREVGIRRLFSWGGGAYIFIQGCLKVGERELEISSGAPSAVGLDILPWEIWPFILEIEMSALVRTLPLKIPAAKHSPFLSP
jgi:hypothetical protein